MTPSYDLRPCSVDVIRGLVEQYHGYGSVGTSATYAWAVFEAESPVAAYIWQPPPPGAAKSVCPEAPSAVLALSRMVAVPRERRQLNHVSKPLRMQMRRLIDRGRWPVLITFSDEGQGHTGHVYKCSGWAKTTRSARAFFTDRHGVRVSPYANGSWKTRDGVSLGGRTTIQRWEHWVCQRGHAAQWLAEHGWQRVPLEGRTWKSGNQAYKWVQT